MKIKMAHTYSFFVYQISRFWEVTMAHVEEK